MSPADVHTEPDGTVVRTLWGELAWQLGGKEGYPMVRSADEKAVSPGDSLRLLFNKYSPCLILIDEWVSYARQLYNKSDLPAGDFDAHFTFAQILSESAKLSEARLTPKYARMARARHGLRSPSSGLQSTPRTEPTFSRFRITNSASWVSIMVEPREFGHL